jgi:CheY-like chemotaxis protein
MTSINNIRSISGYNIYNYLNSDNDTSVPVIIDCLNCDFGCNVGPGIPDTEVQPFMLETKLENRKQKAIQHNKKHNTLSGDLKKYWNKTLYTRTYKDLSGVLSDLKIPKHEDLQNIYKQMKKCNTADILNCTACGYGTCKEMAKAIFNKLNKSENCHQYLRLRTLEKEKLLQEQILKSQQLAIEAEDASKAKSNFLATMSHEIRTPLNAILGFSEIALQKELNGDLQDCINTIANSGRVLLNIVNDILDISKVESGKFELLPVEYDTAQTINDSIMINIVRIKSKPVEFNLVLENNIPKKLFGDELRVKQIINNLLSNAFKYTKKGQVTLNIRFKDNFLEIMVKDTGIGIMPKNLDKLFGEYAQLDAKANRKIEGTGLGLAITKMIVEKMQGTISVESEYGTGSCFTAKVIQKPLTDSVIDEDTIGKLVSFVYNKYDGKNKTIRNINKFPSCSILIVDDVKTNLDVAKGLLMPYKLNTVCCVQSGSEAIKLIEDISQNGAPEFDIIFLDHMMPDMDGIETCQRIRTMGTDYTKNVPVIAFTADAISGHREKFICAGFSDYISKPIETMQLDAIVNKYLGKKAVHNTNVHSIGQEIPDNKNPKNGNLEINSTETGIKKNNYEVAGLNFKAGLDRFGGNLDIYIDIMRSFVNSTPLLLSKMNDITEENISDYAINVHGIKSSGRAIGAEQLGNLAEELEYYAKAGKIDLTKTGNIAFQELAAHLIEDLRSFLKKYDYDNPVTLIKKETPDPDVLKKIASACKKYDIEQIDILEAELEKYTYKVNNDLVKQIKEKLNLSDFAEIIKLIEADKSST